MMLLVFMCITQYVAMLQCFFSKHHVRYMSHVRALTGRLPRRGADGTVVSWGDPEARSASPKSLRPGTDIHLKTTGFCRGS